MSKKLKITTLLIAMMSTLPSIASYKVTIPLEISKGGALQDNTIIFGTQPNTDSGTTPSTNCMYNEQNMVEIFTSPFGQFQIGDIVYVFDDRIVAPNGLSIGKKQGPNSNEPADDYEICFDSTWVPPTGNTDEPIDPNSSDWTPECILDTNKDYAAINTITGKREFYSVSFDLYYVEVPNWIYKPDNYNINNPTSFIFYDNSEQTGEERVSGPNPDFSYSKICIVRKRD